jgi:tyrosinase
MGQIVERENFYSLAPGKKREFVDAIVRLKTTGIYDQYVIWHAQTMAIMTKQPGERTGRNAAHRGPNFLPWHREFLRRFEKDLQMPLPYWKWEEENDILNAEIWKWLGGNGDPNEIVRNFDRGGFLGYRVTQGPCAYENGWTTIEANQGGNPALPGFPREEPDFSIPLSKYPRAKLARAFGYLGGSFPTSAEVSDALKKNNYDSSPWDELSKGFRTALEGFNPTDPLNPTRLHNQIHVWIYGHMSLNTSPNDPLFFLNHCNVDRIWAEWQQDKSDYGYPMDGDIKYNDGEKIDSQNRNDPMIPWNHSSASGELPPTIESVLDHHKLGYKYDNES